LRSHFDSDCFRPNALQPRRETGTIANAYSVARGSDDSGTAARREITSRAVSHTSAKNRAWAETVFKFAATATEGIANAATKDDADSEAVFDVASNSDETPADRVPKNDAAISGQADTNPGDANGTTADADQSDTNAIRENDPNRSSN